MNFEKFFSRAVFSSPVTTLVLSVVTPYVFIWSVNYDSFDLKQLGFGLMILAAFSALVPFFVFGLEKFLNLASSLFLPTKMAIRLEYSQTIPSQEFTFAFSREDFVMRFFPFFLYFLAGEFLVFLLSDFFYNDSVILGLFLGIFFLLCTLFCFYSFKRLGFIRSRISRLSNMTNGSMSPDFFIVVIAIFSTIFLIFILINLIASLETTFFLLSFLILCLLIHGKLLKFLNIMSISFLIMSFSSLLYGMFSMYNYTDDVRNEILPPIEFKHKPNVYLFVLESYHNREVLKNVYGIDISDFENFLEKNDFVIYDDAISRDGHTLPMMYEMLAMRSIFDFPSSDSQKGFEGRYLVLEALARDVLGGNEQNLVFRVFKENGYFNEAFYFNQSYYMERQGAWLDKSDVQRHYWLSPIFHIGAWHHYLLNVAPRFNNAYLIEMPKKMEDNLAEEDRKNPHFMIIKMGAGHTDNSQIYSKAKDWVASGRYQSMFHSNQTVMIPTLETILSSDPQALIILIGDHGAMRLRGYTSLYDIKTLDDLDRFAPVTGITRKDFMNDRFGVFLAVRMPHGYRDVSHGTQMDNRNLFLHIFSELSENPELLKHIAPLDSFYLLEYLDEKARRLCRYPDCGQ
jgi:hypothetical protein